MARKLALYERGRGVEGLAWLVNDCLRIGRSRAAEVCISDKYVSRTHAEIRFDEGRGWLLCDLGSMNGTFLNGVRIGDGRHPLRDGDVIRVGAARLLFSGEEPPAVRVHDPGLEDPWTRQLAREYSFTLLDAALLDAVSSRPSLRPVEAAFLQDILAHPEDDTPRLVYADWLEEHDAPERAEFIRLQCQLARLSEGDPGRGRLLDRQSELLRAHPQVALPLYLAELFRLHKGEVARWYFLGGPAP
jgi:uncharacterized protein (TIGR02996 family)